MAGTRLLVSKDDFVRYDNNKTDTTPSEHKETDTTPSENNKMNMTPYQFELVGTALELLWNHSGTHLDTFGYSQMRGKILTTFGTQVKKMIFM